jgi:hypothetical protein
LVLLHDTKLDNTYSSTGKLRYRWRGPFRVVRANHERGSYVIAELDGAEHKGTVAADRLKPYLQRDTPETSESDQESSHPSGTESEGAALSGSDEDEPESVTVPLTANPPARNLRPRNNRPSQLQSREERQPVRSSQPFAVVIPVRRNRSPPG